MKKIGLLSLILILLMSILVGCDNENEYDTEITMDSGIIIEYEDDGTYYAVDAHKISATCNELRRFSMSFGGCVTVEKATCVRRDSNIKGI